MRVFSVTRLPNTRRPSATANRRGPLRRGFTLIELLIVITITLILAAVTLAAVQAFRTGDVASGSARQVQSFVSGARDRAIYTNRTDEGPRARGVRFLLDYNLTADLGGDLNNDGTTDATPFACTAMQYVESAGFYPPQASGNAAFFENVLNQLFLAGDDPADTSGRPPTQLLPPDTAGPLLGADYFIDQAEQAAIDADDLADDWAPTPLNRLFRAGLLGDPISGAAGGTQYFNARVRLPRYASWGRWYAAIIEARTPGLEQAARLSGIRHVYIMTAPSFTGGAARYNEKAAEYGWVFELRTVPLAGEVPRALPTGTAIDLYSSARLGGLPSSWLVDGVPSGNLDLMFGPDGLVTGPLAASGMIHLPVVSVEDLNPGGPLPLSPQGTFLPVGLTGTAPDGPPGYDTAGMTYTGAGKSDEELIVSVNTQTGAVTVAPVDPLDVIVAAAPGTDRSVGTPGSDGLADDPLYFAETGTEAE